MSFNENWLNLTVEEPLEPEMPVCDAHHHLWEGSTARPEYLVADFLKDAVGHNIVKTVFMECGTSYRQDGPPETQPLGETEFVAGITASTQNSKPAVAAGIVGFVDLCSPSQIEKVLEAHIQAGRGRFRGIRQSCTWDPNPNIISMGKAAGMMTDITFRRNFARLKEYGLVFDAWQYFTQLNDLSSLAVTFPDISIIINHTGGIIGTGPYAGKKDEVFRKWQQGIKSIAQQPNVYMKLGGFGMARTGLGWHEREKPAGSCELAKAVEPYFLYCLEEFGVERCLFESNYPVDKQSCSYTVLWNAYKNFSRSFSLAERRRLFFDNAVKVYRLP